MYPKAIKKLEQDVINRIAAGEIIQRPANALKELIENCLDAESNNIQITVKNGGLKLLQIQDNGTGIRKEDLPILCERFTTSKLEEFEDLHKISTYGFRGEALASISHVAHLNITSKTRDSLCAYQAEYCDSKLKGPPKPLAGNQGTIITVEDLFYNMNVRRNALRSPAEEFQKITDVVSKYSIHNCTVGFALKKHGANNDIRTPPNSTHVENIQIIYGSSISKELLEFSVNHEELKFNCKGYITNANYSTKKFQFLLFINNRLVDSQNLKRTIDAIYQTYLPKNGHPFVYLSLELDPNNVDVNIHPTKHEVHFLNEPQIVEIITKALEQKILGSNNSRVFYTQSKLPNLQFEIKETLSAITQEKKSGEAPKYVIRTDASSQKLDKFFDATTVDKEHGTFLNSSLTEQEYEKQHEEFVENQGKFEDVCLEESLPINSTTETVPKIKENKILKDLFPSSQEAKKCELPLSQHLLKKITKVETTLISIIQLRKAVEENCHRSLRETFAQHVFVGSINRSQALIQFNSQLLLCQTRVILEELFYQLILYNFQNFDCYRLEVPICIKALSLLGLDLPETGWTEDDGPKEELAEKIREILIDKSVMLNEYFSMEIDTNGFLKTLPILLDNYNPDPMSLPLFLIRIATEVNWESEKECFDTFSRELARYYSNICEQADENGKNWSWIVEHVLFPAIKKYFLPPRHFTGNTAILEIANLPNLYKVFERC